MRECSECGAELEGRQRVVCGRRCRDYRYKRLHPEGYAAREARKVERRREKRATSRDVVETSREVLSGPPATD
jgi:hypothetical protein